MTEPRLRVAVIADYAEEGWPSMDLVADMLVSHLAAEHPATVDATLVRPVMPLRLTRIAPAESGRPTAFDRVAARLFDYPRVLAALPVPFDVYHVIDHSYAHLRARTARRLGRSSPATTSTRFARCSSRTTSRAGGRSAG